jgi:hypothetical protein
MKRASFLNTLPGDQIIFKNTGPHWFLNWIENSKKLTPGKSYTVKAIEVASSSTSVQLEETQTLEFELGWFDNPNPHPEKTPGRP